MKKDRLYSNPIDEQTWNQIVDFLKTECSHWHKLVLTSSNGISTRFFDDVQILPCWIIDKPKDAATRSEILILGFGRMWKLQLRKAECEEDDIDGYKSWNFVKKELKKDGVDLWSYKDKTSTKDQLLISRTSIPRRNTETLSPVLAEKELKDVYKLDFNSFFPHCLSVAFPEFRPTMERLFEQRKENPKIKKYLVSFTGDLYSWCGGRFAWMAVKMMTIARKMMLDLENRVKQFGALVLFEKIDAIYILSSRGCYKDENCGQNLGQYKIEHYKRFWFDGPGTQEMIDENGVFEVKAQGRRELDSKKPRSEWTWGDVRTKEGRQLVETFIKGGKVHERFKEDRGEKVSDLFEVLRQEEKRVGDKIWSYDEEHPF